MVELGWVTALDNGSHATSTRMLGRPLPEWSLLEGCCPTARGGGRTLTNPRPPSIYARADAAADSPETRSITSFGSTQPRLPISTST